MALPELRLTPHTFQIEHFLHRTTDQPDRGDPFILDAPYQRGSVWTLDQRQALIKSILMGVPFGSVIIARTAEHYRVIDGKQRIETIRKFADGDFQVPTHWFLDEDIVVKNASGWVASTELSDRAMRRLLHHVFPSLEFDSTLEWIEDPEHPEAVRRQSRWYTRDRTPEEALGAEAVVYMLINGAGTAQTGDDLGRARTIAGGG